MKNRILQFKTNINCESCVASVKPHLEHRAGIGTWDVDIQGKNKVLTIAADGITAQEVIDAVQRAGFKIELLNASNDRI